ncbi:MAG: HDIG domain-containing metalloprotein [Candidatus Dormibacteria bacterium]
MARVDPRVGPATGRSVVPALVPALAFSLPATLLTTPGWRWQEILGTLLLVAASSTAVMWFGLRFRADRIWVPGRLAALALSVGAVLLVARVLFLAQLGGVSGVYLAPLAAAPILAGVLVDPALGLAAGAAAFLWVGVLAHAPDLFALALVESAVGMAALRRLERVDQLLRAALMVALAGLTVSLATGLVAGRPPALEFEVAGAAALGAFVATVVAAGLFNQFGELFGLATPTRLVELTSPSNPALKQLMIAAPGTYQRSLLVANLAEAGALALDADDLLARVGGQFLDLGKVRRPDFFPENPSGVEDPHAGLDELSSGAILEGHVIDGVEMAERYRFPGPVRDIIAQHHGTTAASLGPPRGNGRADPRTQFRYGGPLPRSREAALVLLADQVVERALGLAAEATGPAVRRVVQALVAEGQLRDCDLAFRDVEVVIAAFTDVLGRMRPGEPIGPSASHHAAAASPGRGGRHAARTPA